MADRESMEYDVVVVGAGAGRAANTASASSMSTPAARQKARSARAAGCAVVESIDRIVQNLPPIAKRRRSTMACAAAAQHG